MDEQNYARVLRAIGQNLEELRPVYVEIKEKDDVFIARGRGKIDVKRSPLIMWLWQKMPHRDPNVAAPEMRQRTARFVRRYSPQDIDRLDQSKRAYRTDLIPTPDIHSLGEMLRTIGRIIDAERGRLIEVSRDSQTVTFEYRDAQGASRKKQLSNMQLLQEAAAILHQAREPATPTFTKGKDS